MSNFKKISSLSCLRKKKIPRPEGFKNIFNLIINTFIMFIAIDILVTRLILEKELVDYKVTKSILLFFLSSILVNIIKDIRMYLIIFNDASGKIEYSKTYLKTTFVNLVFPYKLGEIFRMYCYGKQLNSHIKGVVIVILDRFMDTLALVTMIIIFHLVYGIKTGLIVYLLLLSLLILLIAYLSFQELYDYWNTRILCNKATKGNISLLKFLDSINRIYKEVKYVSKGRGFLLYILSLLAWIIEIGIVILQHPMENDAASNYLMSAIGVSNSPDLDKFIMVSIVIMFTMYVVLKLLEVLRVVKE